MQSIAAALVRFPSQARNASTIESRSSVYNCSVRLSFLIATPVLGQISSIAFHIASDSFIFLFIKSEWCKNFYTYFAKYLYKQLRDQILR